MKAVRAGGDRAEQRPGRCRRFRRLVLIGGVLGVLAACVSGGRPTRDHAAAGRQVVKLTYAPFMDGLVTIARQAVFSWLQETSPLGTVIELLPEPDRARVRAATEHWAREVLASREVEEALASIYTTRFSEGELTELIAF